MIKAYCDGSCPPAPNDVGGWAFVILRPDGSAIQSSGYDRPATNNTMELRAALQALREIKAQGWRDKPLTIITDSMYVVQGMNSWRHKWAAEDDFAHIKNSELWRRLHKHGERCRDLRFQWVKGHNGDYWNEWVDRVAGRAQRKGLTAYTAAKQEG